MTRRFVQYEMQLHAIVVAPSNQFDVGALSSSTDLLEKAFREVLTNAGLQNFMAVDHGVRWIAQADEPRSQTVEVQRPASTEPHGLWWHIKQWWRE